MGSRVADAPERSTADAVNNDKREVDLPIMVIELVQAKRAQNERQELKTTDEVEDGHEKK
jgi:hypothetical protein